MKCQLALCVYAQLPHSERPGRLVHLCFFAATICFLFACTNKCKMVFLPPQVVSPLLIFHGLNDTMVGVSCIIVLLL